MILDLSDIGQVGHFSREKVGQVGHFSSGKVGQVGYFEHFLNQNFGQFNTLKMKIRDVEANRSLYIEEVHFVIMTFCYYETNIVHVRSR